MKSSQQARRASRQRRAEQPAEQATTTNTPPEPSAGQAAVAPAGRDHHRERLVSVLVPAVTLRIGELEKLPDDQFAATWAAWRDEANESRAFASEALLYGGKRGEAAEALNQAAKVIAVLSCVPGGVEVFGHHWETQRGTSPNDQALQYIEEERDGNR